MSGIKLKSSDGDVFTVEEQVAKVSETLRTMLDSVLTKNNDEPLLLSNISSSVLEKVIEWMEFHKNDPPATEEDVDGLIKYYEFQSWESDFLSCLDQEILFALIMAANFLNIKSLLDAVCQTLTNMMESLTPEQIRIKFNLDENDFTPEEQAEIEAENEWIEDPQLFHSY